MARRIGEPEGFAVRANESVIERVERKITSEGHSSNNVRGGDKGMGGRIGIITASEVAVIRGYDYKKRVTPL